MFNWTASRLARLASAVRSYNRAITMRARELVDAGTPELVSYLPNRVTTQEIRSRISDVNDFRRIVGYRNDAKRGRTSELTRILRSVRPDALEFVETAGTVRTNYDVREQRYDLAAIRRQRAKTLRDMQRPLFDGDETVELTPDMYSDNDLMPEDAGVPDDSVIDVDADTLARWQREDAQRKRQAVQVSEMYKVYRDTWTHPLNFHDVMPGYEKLLEALDWLAANRPDVLNKAFARSPDELDPYYITESGGTGNPYVNTPYDTRHNRAVNYVVNLAVMAGMYGGNLLDRIDVKDPVYL